MKTGVAALVMTCMVFVGISCGAAESETPKGEKAKKVADKIAAKVMVGKVTGKSEKSLNLDLLRPGKTAKVSPSEDARVFRITTGTAQDLTEGQVAVVFGTRKGQSVSAVLVLQLTRAAGPISAAEWAGIEAAVKMGVKIICTAAKVTVPAVGSMTTTAMGLIESTKPLTLLGKNNERITVTPGRMMKVLKEQRIDIPSIKEGAYVALVPKGNDTEPGMVTARTILELPSLPEGFGTGANINKAKKSRSGAQKEAAQE